MASARISRLVAEVVSLPSRTGGRALVVDHVFVEVLSRTALAPDPDPNPDPDPTPDPLPGNPARLANMALEVLSRTAAQAGAACHCVITPQPAPPKYLMRRPARFR